LPVLDAGQPRVELATTTAYGAFAHLAVCPEVSPPDCAVAPIPAHLHEQSLWWVRPELGVTVGLGRGWEAGGGLPVDLKVARVAYTTPAGAPFEPPYGDIHHRDETLFGVADARTFVRHTARATPRWTLSGELGASLPLGRVEPDPFELGYAGATHQHYQRGIGVVGVAAGVDAWYRAQSGWGALARLDARAPTQENRYGYLQGAQAIAALGPSWRSGGWTWSPGALALVEAPDRWSGEAAPDSGRVAALASLGGVVTPQPTLAIGAELRWTAWQVAWTATPDDQAVQRVSATVSVSWTPAP
jgi:hypothetical protein